MRNYTCNQTPQTRRNADREKVTLGAVVMGMEMRPEGKKQPMQQDWRATKPAVTRTKNGLTKGKGTGALAIMVKILYCSMSKNWSGSERPLAGSRVNIIVYWYWSFEFLFLYYSIYSNSLLTGLLEYYSISSQNGKNRSVENSVLGTERAREQQNALAKPIVWLITPLIVIVRLQSC